MLPKSLDIVLFAPGDISGGFIPGPAGHKLTVQSYREMSETFPEPGPAISG